MEYKLALISPMIHPGDVKYNAQIVKDALLEAENKGAQYLALPHDILSGFTLGDMADHPLIKKAEQTELAAIVQYTESKSAALLMNIRGQEFCIKNGSISFDTDAAPLRLPISDMPNGATATSDIALRNALRKYSDARDTLVYSICPNIGESTGERVFDGYMAVARSGKIVSESAQFSCDMMIVSSTAPEKNGDALEKEPEYTYLSEDKSRRTLECERILNLQAYALKRRLEHIGGRGFVVGVSGGLDSTLALIAAVRACRLMGRDPGEHVLGLSMPGFGTTPRTRANAKKLIEALGAKFEEIDIKEACLVHFKSIGMGTDFDKYTQAELLVLENAQARERTRVLLSISNRDGLLDVGTGDLSEDALGFSTVGGDHLALYGINSSLPKTVMREIVAYYADNDEISHDVLYDILDTPVSPELLPSRDGQSPLQKTEEILGAYALHDLFILNMLKNGMSPAELYELALKTLDFSEQTVYDTLGLFLRRFFSQQFKRNSCTEGPNILFGISPSEFKMPSDITGIAFMREYENIERRKDN